MSQTTSFPKDRIKVLLLEGVHRTALDIFEQQGFHIEAVKGAMTESDLTRALAEVHILGIRSKTQVREASLKSAKRLLTLGCFCIGTNQVDLETANTQGVPVFNAPFSNTRSVAELVVSEIIALSRQLFDRSREVHEGRWRKLATGCYEVRGKTLGIIGYGHIGTQVSVLAEAMGMHVMYYDILTKLPLGNARSVSTLEQLLQHSDFVTLHVPATRETAGMMHPGRLKQMKKGAYLLNNSRGSVVDIPALAAALKEGHLAGAAVDVYPDEPEVNSDGFQSELRGLPNVILTPHIGGSTEEAQAAIGIEVATALTKFCNGGATTGAVNFPHIELPVVPGKHRILNVHKNQPGVLRDINKIVSDRAANIHAQQLATDAHIGYLMMDLDDDVSKEVCQDMSKLETSIKTRILY